MGFYGLKSFYCKAIFKEKDDFWLPNDFSNEIFGMVFAGAVFGVFNRWGFWNAVFLSEGFYRHRFLNAGAIFARGGKVFDR